MKEIYDGAIVQFFSQNCWKGWGRFKPLGIILHYTAWGKATETVNYFCSAGAKASAHFVIDRDGTVFQTVSLNNRAWHAGRSEIVIDGKKYKKLNNHFFGIELANWGLLKQRGLKLYCWPPLSPDGKPKYRVEFHGEYIHLENNFWEKYPKEQIQSLARLCRFLMCNFNFDERMIVGHSDVAPSRKLDPGPAFFWEEFRYELVGDWFLKSEEARIEDLSRKQGNRRDC